MNALLLLAAWGVRNLPRLFHRLSTQVRIDSSAKFDHAKTVSTRAVSARDAIFTAGLG